MDNNQFQTNHIERYLPHKIVEIALYDVKEQG